MALAEIIDMNVSLKTMLWMLLALSSVASLDKYDLCSINGSQEVYVLDVRESLPVGSIVKRMNFNGTREQVNVTATKPSVHFSYEDTTRDIMLIAGLDADSGPQLFVYKLTCRPLLMETGSVFIDVRIALKDENDNPPIFTKNEYFINVSESVSIQSIISTPVKANDKDDDKSSNGKIFYSIVNDTYSHYFDIKDPMKPDLTLVSMLDYESVPSFSIKIMAQDQPLSSQERLNATAILFINVIDVDDLPPLFEDNSYLGTVPEMSPKGTKVNLTKPIFAFDQDVNFNASIKYSIEKAANNYFSIDPDTAVVFVNDPPPAREYLVMIRASQADNQNRIDTVSLTIIVSSTNNSKPPTFLQPAYEVYVPETLRLGSTVLKVSATDTDFGTRIYYYFVGQEEMFTINKDSGVIKLRQPLDYEKLTTYVFQVAASDGQLNGTATVTVRVTDINDNNPIVTTNEIVVEADRVTNAFIAKIEATDNDVDTVLRFSLASHSSLFSITADGELTIAAEPEMLTENKYDVVVIVTDNGFPARQSSALVTVLLPVTTPKTSGVVEAGIGSDVVSICLGVVAATLLIVVILLAVYIVRRRVQSSEQLDKAKNRNSMDPRGLMFKKHPGSRTPSRGAIHFPLDSESPDGGTTVAENPFTLDGTSNYGYVHSDESENDRDIDEIQIETSVIPYENGHGGNIFRHMEDVDGLPKLDHSYQNGSLSTFKDSNSNDSIHSDSTNSKRGLMKNMNGIATKSLPNKKLSWAGGDGDMPSSRSLNSIDGEAGVSPVDEKPEITVYF